MTSSVFTVHDSSADPAGAALLQSLLGAKSGINVVSGSLKLSASAASAINLYDGSLSALGIGAGLLLTSGTTPGVTNTVGWFGQDNSNANTLDPNTGLPLDFYNGNAAIDAVVNTVFQTQSYDATTLGFNFTLSDPGATSISFDVVFGSDEYPEWVDQFVDCAVVIVNGVNYALFNHDPKAPLSVVSPNLAAGYFQDNAGNVLPIEYDGVSHVLKIVAPIIPGQVNSIMIGIADTGDHIYDSGIFIANLSAGNTPGSGVVITTAVPCTDGADVVAGTVADELINLMAGDDVAYAGGGDDIVVAGAGNDTVYGGSGNDVLAGDSGDDYLDGGEGTGNEAVYLGNAASYQFVFDAGSGTYLVTGLQGADTLKSIQIVKFANGLFDLSPLGLSPHATDPGVSTNQLGAVVISGAAMVGQTLTAIVLDGDGVPGSAVSYDWMTSTDGTTWVSTGNSTKSYSLTESDAGSQVRVEVCYTDNAGHAEAPVAPSVLVATKSGLSISLVQLSAPSGAGVQNTLTTLFNNAVSLGFSGNQAMLAIKSVLGVPDVNILTYDPVAILNKNPDATALTVLKLCGELAIIASASDPTAFNLTLAVMNAAAQGKTIDLADPAQLDSLLAGVGATEIGIVKICNKDMNDAGSVPLVMAAWNDFCGNTDGMEAYGNSFENFNVHLNQAPVGFSSAEMAPGLVDTAYVLNAADLLVGFSDPDGDPLRVLDVLPNGGGTITDNQDGSWTFSPDAGFTGPVEVSFTVTDTKLAVTGNSMFVIAPPDTSEPTVTSITYGPNDGTLKAGETVTLTVTMSEKVVVSGVPTLALGNGGSASYLGGTGGGTLTFGYTASVGHDTADLATAATNVLSGSITDMAGNAANVAGFDAVNPVGTLVVDTVAPTVVGFAPADGTTGVAVDANIVLTFSEVIAKGAGLISLCQGSATGPVVESFDPATSTRLSFSGAQLTLDPTSNLANGTSYFVVLSTGSVTDAAGNACLGSSSYDFATAPAGNLITGTTDADTLNGTAGVDVIYGLAGKDVILGRGGLDVLDGGDGADVYLVGVAKDHGGAEFRDTGTSGIDEVRFTSATANSTLTLYAGDTGIERVVIGTGTAAAAVSTGTTTLGINASALTYAISLVGNAGANSLAGGAGNDSLFGGNGNDSLSGGAGNDQLRGGGGSDSLTGNAGSDWFIFDSTPNAASNKDTLTDFAPGIDKLQFSKSVFKGLSVGALKTEAFWSGPGVTAAHDASDRLMYNSSTGALYYDSDGSGPASAVQVALVGISTHPTLSFSDFRISV